MRFCLSAATETLLEKRYGIDRRRATSRNDGEWQVWYSILGKFPKSAVESLIVSRVTLACGVAGFFAIRIAPRLAEVHYILLCSVFVFAGLWSDASYFFQMINPVGLDAIRLRYVLEELQKRSPSESQTKVRP